MIRGKYLTQILAVHDVFGPWIVDKQFESRNGVSKCVLSGAWIEANLNSITV
jgi:hypothetical protein